jgi:hypothetical protein
MALNVTISANIRGQYDRTIGGRTVVDPINALPDMAITNGTGSGKADLEYQDSRTLAASATENLDLAGLLVDAFGQTLTAVNIKAIEIAASAQNTNDVVVGAAASNPWSTMLNSTGTITLKPGGRFVAVAPVGWTVTPGTGDLLKILNGGAGTSVTYTVKLIGASA